ncbi:unnamed protein product [Boreogadus saida]
MAVVVLEMEEMEMVAAVVLEMEEIELVVEVIWVEFLLGVLEGLVVVLQTRHMKQQMIPMPAERSVSAAFSGLKNNPTVRHNGHEWTLSMRPSFREKNATKQNHNPWLAPVWSNEGGDTGDTNRRNQEAVQSCFPCHQRRKGFV